MADAELSRRPALPPRARLGADRRRRAPRSGSPGTPRTRSARSSSSTRRRSARTVTKDEPYAEVESVKAVSDVIAPLSGEIVEVNEALADTPETINEDPYGEGWLVKVKLSDPSERDGAAGRRAPTRRRSADSMSRYTSATDADRARDARRDRRRVDRGAVRRHPGGRAPRPRRSTCRRAWPSRRSTSDLRELAARNVSRRGRDHVPRRRDVRPLRPGADRHDHRALGVPDALHALPARDLPGRAAGDVRVPDGDLAS